MIVSRPMSMYGGSQVDYWLFFPSGNISEPVATMTDFEAEVFVKDFLKARGIDPNIVHQQPKRAERFLIQAEFDNEPLYVIDAQEKNEEANVIAELPPSFLSPENRQQLANSIVAELTRLVIVGNNWLVDP